MKCPLCSHFPPSLVPVVNHSPEFGPYSKACSKMFPVYLCIHKQYIELYHRLYIIRIILYIFGAAMIMRHSNLLALVESNFLMTTAASLWVLPCLVLLLANN